MSLSTYYRHPEMTTAWEFMGDPTGRCFYIPAYQRPFAWKNGEIERFFNGVVADIGEMFRDKERDVSFAGTIVCYDDRRHETVHPSVKNEVPETVYNVIDGQQRFTVIMVTCALLHDIIRNLKGGVKSDWLQDRSEDMLEKLGRMTEVKLASGECPHYPRMIRAFEDKWSRVAAVREYISPLSYFIASYGDFSRTNGADGEKVTAFSYDSGAQLSALTAKQQNDHETFGKAVALILKMLRRICDGKDERLPDIGEAINNEEFLKEIFQTQQLLEGSFSDDNNRQCKLARAILFASYLINKVHFVTLLTYDESYAFDVFESLNATGEPLTAYETFKPEVVRAEKLEHYRNTDSKKHIDAVDGLLSSNRELASDMLITFALAETGEPLSKKLPLQRRFLRKQYDKHGEGMPAKRLFTRHLMHTALVYRHLWLGVPSLPRYTDSPFNGDYAPETMELVKEADFCLWFLGAANNHIALAPITRFYEHVCLAPDARAREERVVDFCKAVRAIASFFALWRSSRPTTDGIDNRYRFLMKGIHKDAPGHDKVVPLCRTENNTPLYDDVRRALLFFLREDGNNRYKMLSCEDWVEHCGKTQMYSMRQVCKFLLMISAHRTRPQEGGSGLLEAVVPNAGSDMIDWGAWDNDDYKTVEHVLPQSGDMHPDIINRLGNLTLVPLDVNAILGTHNWEKKRMIYRILSAETEAEQTDAFVASSVDLPESTHEKLGERIRCLPMTKALASMETANFGEEEIKAREANLLPLAWRILAKDWLEWDKE